MLSAFKNFGITFLVSGIIFGLIGFFITTLVTDTVGGIVAGSKQDLDDIIQNATDTSDGASSSTSDIVSPPIGELPDGNSFSLLLGITDYDPALHDNYLPTKDELADLTEEDIENILSRKYRTVNMTSLILIRGDKERGEYTYTPLSCETEIYASCGYITIGESYGFYGEEFVADTVWALTGIKPDLYFFVNVTELEEVLPQLPGVTYTIPTNIYFNGDDYGSLTLMAEDSPEGIPEPLPVIYAGYTSLNAERLRALTTYRENDVASHDIKAEIDVSLAKLYLKAASSLDSENLILRIEDLIEEELVKTNVSGEWLEANYEMLAASATFNEKTITYPGTFIARSVAADGKITKGYFSPSVSTAVDLFAPYRFLKTENSSENKG